MNARRSKMLAGMAILSLVLGLPLLGALIAGRNVNELLRFPPPLDIPDDYLRWSWWAAGAVAVCLGGVVASWLSTGRRQTRSAPTVAVGAAFARRFPAWGYAAIGWTLLWWVLAWRSLDGFPALQRYSFFPLWVGFIVTVNALTERRAGSCLMRRASGRWLALFAASAACWWVFEWLNRFVGNWHYLGVEDFGALKYAGYGTLCFSTVLPALAAVAEWLDTHRSWRAQTAAGPKWRWLARREAAAIVLIAGVLGLVGSGGLPRAFYPALWVAPLALGLSIPVLGGHRDGLAGEIARGDWSRAATWMMAALICGFFWELWNWHSAAKWIYTVPGVERWHVFEMPLLGYVGYLPFGLECLLVVEGVTGGRSAAANSDIAGRERMS